VVHLLHNVLSLSLEKAWRTTLTKTLRGVLWKGREITVILLRSSGVVDCCRPGKKGQYKE
jgi:hypothetical protein